MRQVSDVWSSGVEGVKTDVARQLSLPIVRSISLEAAAHVGEMVLGNRK